MEFVGLEKVKPTEQDVIVLRKLLSSLQSSTEEETPGVYEKRLTSEKIIPKSHAGTRQSILVALAMAGVIPNHLIATSYQKGIFFEDMHNLEHTLRMPVRSDIEMPWAAWNGSLKVNMDMAEKLFGKYL